MPTPDLRTLIDLVESSMSGYRSFQDIYSDYAVDAYHGTTDDFDRFDKIGDEQLGYHFGSTPEQANARLFDLKVRGQEAGAKILPVHLRLNRPLRVPDLGKWNSSTIMWGLSQYQAENRKPMPADLQALFDRLQDRFAAMDADAPGSATDTEAAKLDLLVSGLKGLGYDGFVYENDFEGRGDSYMVFDPHQIRGRFARFDPAKADSPNIMDGRNPAGTPLVEKAPPGMEEWIDHRTPDFQDRYGDAWERVLYATAWKRYHASQKKKKKHKRKKD